MAKPTKKTNNKKVSPKGQKKAYQSSLRQAAVKKAKPQKVSVQLSKIAPAKKNLKADKKPVKNGKKESLTTKKSAQNAKSAKVKSALKSSKKQPTFMQRVQLFLNNVSKPSNGKTEKKSPVTANKGEKETKKAVPALVPDKKVAKPAVTKRKFKADKKVILPLIGIIIFALIAYAASRFLVVAWVDQQPITRFEYYSVLDKRYGKDIREQLIVQKLIESEAAKRHISVTPTEINNEISKIEQQQGGAAQLDQTLQTQGLDRSDLYTLVKLQLLRDKMFGSNVTVSDKEIDDYIQQNKANLPQIDPSNASATAQFRQSIKDQLTQQKISTNFNNWLQSQLNSNRVIRL